MRASGSTSRHHDAVTGDIRPRRLAGSERKARRVWAAVSLGLASLMVVGGLTVWGWNWADTTRTELAQWIMAATSIATLVAAVIAAVFAAGAFRLESDREDRWNDTQRRVQASVVAAWADGIQMASGNIGPLSVLVRVRNASDVPITSVVITVLMRTLGPSGAEHGSHVFGATSKRLIPPNAQEHTISIDAQPFVNTRDLLPEGVPSLEFQPYVSIEFTDSAGIRWLRTHHGLLIELPVHVRETAPLTDTGFMFRGKSGARSTR